MLAESAGRGSTSYEGVMAVAGGFGQLEHAALLEPYVDKYFDVLPVWWETRGEHLRHGCWATRFSTHTAASAELLERVDSFLAEDERDPSMARVLIERRDLIDRTLRSRALAA